MIYTKREVLLKENLPAEPLTGWESLRNEILSFTTNKDAIWKASSHGKIGVFVIVCNKRSYTPPLMKQRSMVHSSSSMLLVVCITKHHASLMAVTSAKLCVISR